MSATTKSVWAKLAVIRRLMPAVALLVMIAATALPGFSQSNPDLQAFFQQNIGLSPDQIAVLRSGQAVAKALPSRTPAEVSLFGAVYIHAAPESYIRFARDFDRLLLVRCGFEFRDILLSSVCNTLHALGLFPIQG